MDFHVLGKQLTADKANWRSSGTYVNDDGLSLDYTDKWNRYEIAVDGLYSDKTETITVKFTQKVSNKVF